MLANQIQHLTLDGLHQIQARLDYLRNTRRSEIAARLHQAVEDLNDLVENAEYTDAKYEQAFVEGEIRRLETILSDVEIIDNTSPPDIVGLGDKVKVQQQGSKKTEIFHIVGVAESDPSDGRISNESPLGSALLGHHIGERVIVDAPDGNIVFTIKAILI